MSIYNIPLCLHSFLPYLVISSHSM
jgi:hypothetical protein